MNPGSKLDRSNFFLMKAFSVIMLFIVIPMTCVVIVKIFLKVYLDPAALKGLKPFLSGHKGNAMKKISMQAFGEEDNMERVEPAMFAGIRESEERDNKSESQHKALLNKLEETNNRVSFHVAGQTNKLREASDRISTLVADQISLRARVARWEEGTPFSHGKNPQQE